MEASMVCDIALMLIFIFIVWRGWHQGVVSEILRLSGWVAAAVLVSLYAVPWAEKIYHAAVEPRVISAVTAAIPPDVLRAMESGAVAVQGIQETLNGLTGILGGQIIDDAAANAILAMLRQDPGSLAQAVTQTVLQPMLVSVMEVILGLIMLAGCLFLSRALARLTASRRRRKDTILSMTNRLLGLALGIGEGLVTAYVYVFCLSLLSLLVNASWLNQSVLDNTVIVRLLL